MAGLAAKAHQQASLDDCFVGSPASLSRCGPQRDGGYDGQRVWLWMNSWRSTRGKSYGATGQAMIPVTYGVGRDWGNSGANPGQEMTSRAQGPDMEQVRSAT